MEAPTVSEQGQTCYLHLHLEMQDMNKPSRDPGINDWFVHSVGVCLEDIKKNTLIMDMLPKIIMGRITLSVFWFPLMRGHY